jgi:hypothetical protein
MSSLRAVYRPRVDITPDQARDARARAWSYILTCYEKHKVADEDYVKNAKNEGRLTCGDYWSPTAKSAVIELRRRK